MSEPQAEMQEPTEEPTEEPTLPGEPTEEDEVGEEEEQETQEQDGPEPPEGERRPRAAGEVSEKELDRMFAKVERANVAYVKRIGESMGEEFGVLEQCPRCASPFLGFIFPPMMQPVTAETKAKVMLSVGEEPEEVTEDDPYSRRCDTCNGRGRCKTGSLVTRERFIRCLRCDARGWIPVGDERTLPANREQAIPTGAAPVVETNGHSDEFTPAPDEDLWGRSKNHPDYGVHPMYTGAR
jgi:hypothetical protein